MRDAVVRAALCVLMLGLAPPPAQDGSLTQPETGFTVAAINADTKPGAGRSVSRAFPLHTAALYNRPKAVKLLVDRGMPVDMRNADGLTPLMVASAFGNVEVAEMLLTLGADQRARNATDGHAAIHIAAMAGHVGVMKLLLDKGGEIGLRAGRNSETPLHCAALYGRMKMIDYLAAHGAELNATDNSGLTPLQYARRRLQSKAADRLIVLGARIDSLHDAVNAGDVARVVELLAKGADVNGLDLFGTPLHVAAAKGQVGIAVILIDRGADLEAQGEPVNARPLHTAALNDQLAMAELLIDRGAKVDARDAVGMTPLMTAATFANSGVAKLLLAHGADPKAEDTTWRDMPIHYAACSGDLETAKLLLRYGVDINAVGRGNGTTPLHYAAQRGDARMIEFLIAAGANLNVVDKSGWTPYSLASGNLHQQVADEMRRLGATR